MIIAYLRKYTWVRLMMAVLTFGLLMWHKVFLANKAKGWLKIFLLLNSLVFSDFAIIATRYQNSGKMSSLSSFSMRVFSKFINIVIAKSLITRELPKSRDFVYFLLLIIHLASVSLYNQGLEFQI